MSWIAVGVTAASMLMQQKGKAEAASAAKGQAKAMEKGKEFEAAQLEQQANNALATSQVVAQEQRRQARLVQSRTLAVAAASGGGVSDPTVVNMLARVAGEGSYRASVALYGGEEKARFLRMQAQAADYEGETGIISGNDRARAYEIQGMGNLITGAGSLYAKYNTMPKPSSGLETTPFSFDSMGSGV